MNPALQARIDAVRANVDIVAVIAKGGVVLSKGRNPRGKCPFHGSKSDSFAVYPDKGYARCWSCPWSGDAIRFVADTYGLSFGEALRELEEKSGLDGLTANPVQYRKTERRQPERPLIDSAAMGRWLWRRATHQPDAVRTYLAARGVPRAMLGDHRLGDIRFHPFAPIAPWPEGQDGPDRDCPKAPALCALIRQPETGPDGRVLFRPIGLHVTFLAPSLEAKMVRTMRDGRTWPDRMMMGRAGGGCVLLGHTTAAEDGPCVTIDPQAALFDGEGIETVLSGMALCGAGDAAIGLAALSLGNLEGQPRLWKGGIWPLFDIRPDPERRGIAFPHWGPVTVLVDADMKPLRGPKDPRTGEREGLPIVERRGGPIVRRAITTAERAEICAALTVQNWRAAGSRRARAVRPHMGMDFNDAIREGL